MSSHKPRGYSVHDFLSWYERSELVLQPKFQRRSVWSLKARSHLIDTILSDLPIPIIFIRQKVDPKQRKAIREVVDGQQRLNAVIDYSNDDFPVLKSQSMPFGGLKFSQLPQEAQQEFLNYEFSVVLLEEVSDADVLNIFARLNTYAQKLTPQELLNAAYYGEFKQTVYRLGYDHLEFWRQNHVLADRQIVRMAEAELTTEILVVMLSGIQHRRNKIEKLYDNKDDHFPERTRVVRQFKAVIDVVANCFGDTLRATIFGRRVLFYSLFCAFYHAMYGIPDTPELGRGGYTPQISSSRLKDVRNSLLSLSNSYKSPSRQPELRKFLDASQKATGDREQRITRVKTILKFIQRGLAGKA
jgi:hypothetical protein